MTIEQRQRRWWQRHGSTAVHEIIDDLGEMAVVATLTSNDGWNTYKGQTLEFVDADWPSGRLLEQLPAGATAIHTTVVAGIIARMTVVPDDEVLEVEARCRAYIAANKAVIAGLDPADPALRAMALLLRSCRPIGWGGRISRKDAEKATQLEAHLRYLKDLIASYQAAA